MSFYPSTDDTRRLRRPILDLKECGLSVFEPVDERTTAGLGRFLLGCRVRPDRLSPQVPSLPNAVRKGYVLRIGNASRYLLEMIVLRESKDRSFALYAVPPPDLRTLLPELEIVDHLRVRATLEHKDGRSIMFSPLTLDEVSHLIVLAQGPSEPVEAVEEFESVDIFFDED